MHELAVTQNILDLAAQYAGKEDNARVTDLHLVIGALSSIIDDSVAFYWGFLAEGTICEGARLHFTRLPAVFLCIDCDRKYELENGLRACPHCKGHKVKLQQGEEFLLESIEVEFEDSIDQVVKRERA